MTHRIFHIPEILQLICRLVERYDLVRLLTVSRLFFSCAAPLLWGRLSGARRLCIVAWPIVRSSKFNEMKISWANLQDLRDRPPDHKRISRFNLYAPYVKELAQYHVDGSWDRFWELLLRLVPVRPLLPNLRVFTLFAGTDPMQMSRILDSLVCPTLCEIRTPGCAWGSLHPVFSSHLVSRIAESCPNIHTLELYTETLYPRPLSGMNVPGYHSKPSLFASLGQEPSPLRNLRTFGAGPEVLSPDVVALLGNLPCLESLTVCFPNHTPEQMVPGDFPPLPNSFPALQHVGIYSRSAPLITRFWRKLPFVRRITSVYIKALPDLDDDDSETNLICLICRSSPNITDLHLEFTSDSMLTTLDLLTPSVLHHLGQLPLERVRILTYSAELLSPHDAEQFAHALSNVEYLDLQDCYLTLENLAWMAKHMPKLQFLISHNLELPTPPTVSTDPISLPLTVSPSPSTLYLESFFTADKRFGSHEVTNEYIKSLAETLFSLWPSGVHCEFADLATGGYVTGSDLEHLKLLNTTIKQLCAPKMFNLSAVNRERAAKWKFTNDRNIRWLLYS